MEARLPKLTIITNSRGREPALVERSLRASLSELDAATSSALIHPDSKLVFIDQNSSPMTVHSDIVNHSRIQIQNEVVPAVSSARNRAHYPNDADWLLFCDDDGYLAPGYLQKWVRQLVDFPQFKVICGSIRRTDNQDFYSRRHAVGGDMRWFWNTKLLMGSNFSIQRAEFESLGKFDEQFGAGAIYGSSEETDLAWNAYFHGTSMVYAPQLVVFHVPPFAGDVASEVKKAERYGFGKGRLVRKWLKRGKIVVAFELAEMITIPVLRMVLSIAHFSFGDARIYGAMIRGRFFGLL